MNNKYRVKTVRIIFFIIMSVSLGVCGQNTMNVKLDAALVGNKISPQLFGHNLEHTRKAIWQGISAEMIANRKFAATDNGMPMRWYTLNGQDGRVSIDTENAYTGEHSIRFDNPDSTTAGIWQQHDWLTFAKNKKYAFRVWVKSKTDQTASIQLVTREGFTEVFSESKTIKAGDWQLWSGEFISPVLARGTRLQITLRTPGKMWLGVVSLMPADNFHGMRRDVIELLKELKPGNMRWPGGCFAEYYNWKDGLLPVDKRPPIGPHQWVGLLPDTDGYDNHEIGIDEFIALCRELNCDPHITIRYGGEGTTEEAAAWVEYCNGSQDTHWGSIRAKRGYKKPYGIKYWYVGNEISGMSLVKDKTPEACGKTSIAYAKAMKEVDCSIILNSGAPANKDWLNAQSKAEPDLFEMVQLGFYFQPHERYMDDASRIVSTTNDILHLLDVVRKDVDAVSPGKKLGLIFYEWNIMWDREGDVFSGVFAAEMLNLFCRNSDKYSLDIASYFQPITEGAIKVGPITSQLQPDGQVFKLYSAHQGNKLLITPDISDKQIDLCASLAPDSKSIFITIVNQNVTSECALELLLTNISNIDNCYAELLIPKNLEVGGDVIKHDKNLKIIDNNKITLKLPPFSIAGVHLSLEDNSKSSL